MCVDTAGEMAPVDICSGVFLILTEFLSSVAFMPAAAVELDTHVIQRGFNRV